MDNIDPDHDLDSWAAPIHECSERWLLIKWRNAKQAEADATRIRRDIEDELVDRLRFNLTEEGTQSVERDAFKVVCTTRMNRKVDAEKMHELAVDAGISDLLPTLCRWKPELNLKAWKSADESITKVLAASVETKPGRPSFKIEALGDK